MIPSREWASRIAACVGPNPSWELLEALDKVAALIQQNAIESASKWLGSSKVYYSNWTVHHDCQQDCAEKLLEFIPK